MGLCTTDGVYIDGERTVVGDMTGPMAAQMVLRDPRVDFAVLETARGGLPVHQPILLGAQPRVLRPQVRQLAQVVDAGDEHVGRAGEQVEDRREGIGKGRPHPVDGDDVGLADHHDADRRGDQQQEGKTLDPGLQR